MNEPSTSAGFTVGVGDDIHSFWRPGNETTSTWAVSTSAGLTRTAIWYTPNTVRAAGNVYVAPNGCFDALAVLVIEVAGLGPWDTVTGINTNYAAAATTLNLALGAPSGAAFLVGAIGGDNNANGQAFAPATWTTLHTVSATNGTDHTSDAQLTSAWLTTSGSISVNGTASSPIDLSGAVIGVLQAASSPIPASQNPNWPLLKFEVAPGGGFQTPPDQLTWTDLTNRLWSWTETTGIQYQLDNIQATDMTMEVDNFDAFLSSDNPASLFYAHAGWAPQATFYDNVVSGGPPLGWWKLADVAGTTTIADSSGNGHTGTATSVTFGNTNEAVTGNTSASFASASTSHVLTSYNPALSAVTVEAWVNLNSLSQASTPRIMANSIPSSDNKGFQLALSGAGNNVPQIWFGNTSTFATVTAPSALPASGWTYLAATWDGTTVTLYVNGVAQGTAALSGTMPAGTATGIGIGYNPFTPGNYANGLLAECAIYGIALTSGQVAARYTAGPDVTGMPMRIRAALGIIGGVTVNRWYVIQRNLQEWPQEVDPAYRRMITGTGTDIWSVVSASCPTPYRGEVTQDAPYAWWPCDDQLLAGGVLPTSLRNAAAGNTNTLAITQSAATAGTLGSGAALPLFYVNEDGWSAIGTEPPSSPVYFVGAQLGWMYGDPQTTASTATGNPVTANPGAAAWEVVGASGTIGSQGWFLSCTDSNFPPLSGGVTVECWFNYAFAGTGTGFLPNWTGPATIGVGATAMQLITPGNTPVLGQPSMPLTILELATASAPVAVLQLDQDGHLDLLTYNGAVPTSNSVYTGSDLRSNSWHHVAVTLTTTAWTVYVDGGATATVSGSAAGMTSAWTTLIANGDLGTGGSSSSGLATAFVQQKSKNATSAGSLTVTLDRPTTAGNCLAVCVGIDGAAVTVSSITLGGAAGNFTASKTVVNGTTPRAEIWTDPNCTGNQTAVAVTLSGSAVAFSVTVMEFSGILTSTPVDQTASNTGTTVQSWASGTTSALAVPGEIAVGAVAIASGTTLTGPGGSWTNTASANTTANFLAGWAPTASTAGLAYSGYTSSGGTTVTYASAVITLKPVGLAHSGNVALAHLAVYPSRLPAWRLAAHYWAAFTAFGQIPAPTAVAMQWVSGGGAYAPDGSTAIPQAGPNALGGYQSANGVLASAVVTANTPAGLTSGPSPWASTAGYFPSATADMWVSWIGVAPQFNVYTGPNVGTEKQASVTRGSGDSFVNGYGLGAIGEGTGQASGISVVQTAMPDGAFTSPITVVLKNPTTAGNCLAVFISTGATTITSVTLGGGADHFAAAVSQVNSPTSSGSAHIWVDPNCAGGQTTVVVTPGTVGSTSVLVMELSGVATSTPIDQTANNTGTSGATNSSFTSTATATLAQTADVAIGMVVGPIGTISPSTTDATEFTAFTMSDIGLATTDHAVAGIAGLSTTAGIAFDGTCTVNAAYAAVVATLKSTWTGSAPPASASATGDSVAQRIERILTYGETTYPGRCIDPAALAVRAATDVGGQQTGQNMVNIAQSDSGLLYVDSQGNLTYWQKSHLAAQYSSPAWTLTPVAPPTPGAPLTAVPYQREGFRWTADPQRVWNAIQITPFSPDESNLASITPASATAVSASQVQYGAQPRQVTSYLQSTAEMQSQANWYLANFGQTQIRVEEVKIDAAPYPAAWPVVLGLNVGDLVTVQNWQIGGGAITGTFRVSTLRRKIIYGDDVDPIEASLTLALDFEPTSYWS